MSQKWLFDTLSRLTSTPISYLKAWRAKQRVFKMRFGTYEASYDNIPRMLSQVAARNPRNFYDTYLVPAVIRGQSILQRGFFCLGACVRTFQCCLPVICIDGIFLTGRYKGQILTAIGVDCNNQIVPLAFAFVENENLDSWYWFLEWVKVHVVAARLDVCLISDRHAGLLQINIEIATWNCDNASIVARCPKQVVH